MPTISSWTGSGSAYSQIVITGTGFRSENTTSVTINGTPVYGFFADYDDVTLYAYVAPGTTSGFIVVTTDSGTASTAPQGFTVDAPFVPDPGLPLAVAGGIWANTNTNLDDRGCCSICQDGSNWHITDAFLDVGSLTQIAYGNGTFVAVGVTDLYWNAGFVKTSPDGVNWTPQGPLPIAGGVGNFGYWYPMRAIWTGTQFVVSGSIFYNQDMAVRTQYPTIWTSPDGVTWTQRGSPNIDPDLPVALTFPIPPDGSVAWNGVDNGGLASNGDLIVAGWRANATTVSTDGGATWTTHVPETASHHSAGTATLSSPGAYGYDDTNYILLSDPSLNLQAGVNYTLLVNGIDVWVTQRIDANTGVLSNPGSLVFGACTWDYTWFDPAPSFDNHQYGNILIYYNGLFRYNDRDGWWSSANGYLWSSIDPNLAWYFEGLSTNPNRDLLIGCGSGQMGVSATGGPLAEWTITPATNDYTEAVALPGIGVGVNIIAAVGVANNYVNSAFRASIDNGATWNIETTPMQGSMFTVAASIIVPSYPKTTTIRARLGLISGSTSLTINAPVEGYLWSVPANVQIGTPFQMTVTTTLGGINDHSNGTHIQIWPWGPNSQDIGLTLMDANSPSDYAKADTVDGVATFNVVLVPAGDPAVPPLPINMEIETYQITAGGMWLSDKPDLLSPVVIITSA